MPLQGSLRDFGFVEVLQLISSQEKIGILRLNGDVGREVLVFDQGDIISAWDPRVTNRDPFREFLIRREVVPRESLRRVYKAEIRSPHSFAEILLRMKVVAHADIQDAFAEHIQERIDDLVLWERGSFEFIPQESVAPYAPGISLKAEGLLMEAVRRVDEGTGALVRPETVLRRIPDPESIEGERAALSTTADRLIAMLDGATTLGVLMREGGFARGEALSAATELIEKQYVEVCSGQGADDGVASTAPPVSLILGHATLLAAILFGSVFGFRWFAPPPDGYEPESPTGLVYSRLSGIRNDRSLVGLRVSLAMSHHMHGVYPIRLEQLVGDGLLGHDDLRALMERRLIYYSIDSGHGYRIESRDAAGIVRRPKSSR